MSKKYSFLITAGPTREFIDPVRFISNPSTGKMGYALAQAAIEKGHCATLISGPTSLTPPECVEIVKIISARDLCKAVLERIHDYDILIMAAAVADYTPKSFTPKKIKKSDADMLLELERTADILKEVGKTGFSGIKVGFAAETDHLEQYALSKLKDKRLHIIVANDITRQGAGFGADTNAVSIFSDRNDRNDIHLKPKREVAAYIIDYIVEYIASARPN